MVMASGRWLGVRLDLLASMLIGKSKSAKNDTKSEDLSLRNHACLIRNRADQYILYHFAVYLLVPWRCIAGTRQDYNFGLN